MRRRSCAFAALCLLTAPAASQAALIDQTFENPAQLPAYNYAYAYAGGGNPATDRGSLTSSRAFYDAGGVDGTRGFVVEGDFTQLSTVPPMPDYNYSGFGGGLGFFFHNFETNTPQGLPSPNLADYTGSIDLAVAGTSGTGTGGEIQVQLQVPDDFFVPDADTNFTPFANINIPVRIGTEFQNYQFSLDQVPIVWDAAVPAAERNFLAHYRDIGLINLNFNVDAGAPFGNDGGNLLLVDNVTLLPEPRSLMLLAAGSAFCLVRRRRTVLA